MRRADHSERVSHKVPMQPNRRADDSNYNFANNYNDTSANHRYDHSIANYYNDTSANHCYDHSIANYYDNDDSSDDRNHYNPADNNRFENHFIDNAIVPGG
jgi:hypothetical protein